MHKRNKYVRQIEILCHCEHFTAVYEWSIDLTGRPASARNSPPRNPNRRAPCPARALEKARETTPPPTGDQGGDGDEDKAPRLLHFTGGCWSSMFSRVKIWTFQALATGHVHLTEYFLVMPNEVQSPARVGYYLYINVIACLCGIPLISFLSWHTYSHTSGREGFPIAIKVATGLVFFTSLLLCVDYPLRTTVLFRTPMAVCIVGKFRSVRIPSEKAYGALEVCNSDFQCLMSRHHLRSFPRVQFFVLLFKDGRLPCFRHSD